MLRVSSFYLNDWLFSLVGRLLLSTKDSGIWTDLSTEKPLSIAYEMITQLSIRSDARAIIVIEKVSGLLNSVLCLIYRKEFSNDFTKMRLLMH